MIDLLTPLNAIKEALRLAVRIQRVTIATASPLTVTLRDGTTVPGIAVTGLTYTAGSAAVVLIADRGQPVVLPTS